MRRLDDGQVVLSTAEAQCLANILEEARGLAKQTVLSEDWSVSGDAASILTRLDLLEELGVSSYELTGKLDLRRRGE